MADAPMLPMLDRLDADAVLDRLRQLCSSTAALAERLRTARYGDDRREFARALVETAASAQYDLDTDVDHARLATALDALSSMVFEGERLLLADELRVVLDVETFARIEDAALAIGTMSGAAWIDYHAGLDLQTMRFLVDCAPTPTMHVLQRAMCAGVIAADGAAIGDELAAGLRRDLRAHLRFAPAMPDANFAPTSPMGAIARAVSEAHSLRWQRASPLDVRREHRAARGRVARELSRDLDCQREVVGHLPNLASAFDTGHGFGLLQRRLHDIARSRSIAVPHVACPRVWEALLEDDV